MELKVINFRNGLEQLKVSIFQNVSLINLIRKLYSKEFQRELTNYPCAKAISVYNLFMLIGGDWIHRDPEFAHVWIMQL
jgi:hypothetical protein